MPLFHSVPVSRSRGWQQERESAANEDTLDFLVILGLIIPAYLLILIASSSFTHVQTFNYSDPALLTVQSSQGLQCNG